MRRNGQRRQRPGGAGCSALGDASGVRCGRASLPPVTVGAGCVTRGKDGPSIPESPCPAIVPGITTICEDAQGPEIAGWAAAAPQPPAAPGPGDRRGWQGGIGAPRAWGSPRPNALHFSEAFGLPSPAVYARCSQLPFLSVAQLHWRRRDLRAGQCRADGGMRPPSPEPSLRMRPSHQQGAQPARWRGQAGVAGDFHEQDDQTLCGVGHGGSVGCSIGFPGAVTECP